MAVHELTGLLGDETLSATGRQTRLQGWRGDDARPADDALAQRLGPAACAVGSFVGIALESPIVLGVTAAFVAATGRCVPSMLFTMPWGAERACERDLHSAR